MWLISARDLQYRLRRFLIAIAVTALVFAIAVAIDGIKQTLNTEPAELVESFGVDGWVVRKGSEGPFTSTLVFPESVAADLRATNGVTSAEPVVMGRATVLEPEKASVNLVGFDLDRGGPEIAKGRAPRGPREVVAGGGISQDVGDTVKTSSGDFAVVGKVAASRFNGGSPTMFLSVKGAQALSVGGAPLVMGVAVTGTPERLPDGMILATNAGVVDDLRLILGSASSTIDFVALLTWIIAAGVIGAIIYLSAIERTRDFAVMRATGVPNRFVVGGLMIQSMVLSITAALISVPLALVLKQGMPMPVTITAGSIVRIVIVGIVVGVVASLAAVRRAITTDPALAFGGA